MSGKSDTWMPFYVSDYLGDTMHLSTEQHGAYLLLLMHCWRRHGSLPSGDAQLAAIARLKPAEWKKHRETIREFFQERGDLLVHKRVLEEVSKTQALSEKRRDAGSKGSEARWGVTEPGSRSERLAIARSKATHTEQEWQALILSTGSKCLRCGTLASDLNGGIVCKDHIIAIAKGGSDGLENLQPMCRECNTSKGAGSQDFRDQAAPGWQDRLAKCLAHARQTPRPSQPHSPTFGGEEEASQGEGIFEGGSVVPFTRREG